MPQSKKRKGRKPATRKPKTPKEEAVQKAASNVSGGVLVTLVETEGGQTFNMQLVEGTTPREIPTLLRQAATHYEKQLVEG